jgi:hypothetical protein
MSALRAGSLKAPAADTVKTSESRPVHLTIGIGRYLHMPAQWPIARRIEPFIDEGHIPDDPHSVSTSVAPDCSTSFPALLKRSICASTAFALA